MTSSIMVNTKRIKVKFLLMVLLLIISHLVTGQNRTVHYDNYKIHLKYHKEKLVSFIYIRTDLSYFMRNKCDKIEYVITWNEGKAFITNKQKSCGNEGYTFKYDSLYRIYEASTYAMWSNHSVDYYLAKKYYGKDTIPYKCFYYYELNYPFENELSYDCNKEINWLTLIENELKTRNKFYFKGSNSYKFEFFPTKVCDEFFKFCYE